MRNKLAVLALCLAVFISSAGRGQAAQIPNASNITVRPFLQNITISQGDDSKQFDLIITNGSKFAQIFHFSTINFGSLNETGGLVFEGSNINKVSGRYGLAKWLSLDRNDIRLEAGQQTTVKVTIRNDRDLSPGAHYAAVVTTASKPVAAVNQLTITPKVSSLIFATKLGGELYDIHLSSVSHNGNLWRLPADVDVRLKSTGNTYITPRGVVSLKQGKTTISRGIINAQSGLVLPGAVRSFDVPMAKLAPPKKGLLFTKFSLQVDYRYDGVSQFAAKTIQIKKLNTTTAGVGLILVLLSIFLAKNGFFAKAIKKLQKTAKK